MSRPIEYEREDVLDKTLITFWRMGHAGCSIQALVDATGMSRQGIYNTFGDKDGLFREVVAHYSAKVAQQCRGLEATGADMSSLRRFIKETLTFQQSMGPGACFIVISAFSAQANDPKLRPALDRGANIVRKAFAAVLANEEKRGNLLQSLSPEDAAAHLYCVMNGLSALAQTGGVERQIDTALDLAFQALRPNKEF